jgi:hypothetical protein
MICDLDDFEEENHRLDLLWKLKALNPAFKVTLFAVPALGSNDFWDALPDWCELAVHGHRHTQHECAEWSYERMARAIEEKPPWFVDGFKAPYWQISDGCYRALEDAGWWVADQHLEDDRRPPGLRTYFYEDGDDRWHGHVQDVCGNGLAETWEELSARVAEASDFQFASESFSVSAYPVGS